MWDLLLLWPQWTPAFTKSVNNGYNHCSLGTIETESESENQEQNKSKTPLDFWRQGLQLQHCLDWRNRKLIRFHMLLKQTSLNHKETITIWSCISQKETTLNWYHAYQLRYMCWTCLTCTECGNSTQAAWNYETIRDFLQTKLWKLISQE